jgi:hypothetical protein
VGSAYNHEKTLKKAVRNGSLGTSPAIPKRNPPRIRAANAIDNDIKPDLGITWIVSIQEILSRLLAVFHQNPAFHYVAEKHSVKQQKGDFAYERFNEN